MDTLTASMKLIEVSSSLDGETRRIEAILGLLNKGYTEYTEQGLEMCLEELKTARQKVQEVDRYISTYCVDKREKRETIKIKR